jgi:hypothetical protein
MGERVIIKMVRAPFGDFRSWDDIDDWARAIQPLFAGDWEGQVAVALTCRPDHWANALSGLAQLAPQPQVVRVEPFTDIELDQLLGHHGLQRREFSDDLLRLMRVPRLSRLAITRREELEQSGDITAERLIFEDWKNRLENTGVPIPLTDRELALFVSNLGRKLRDGVESPDGDVITRREVLELLSRESGREQRGSEHEGAHDSSV